MRQFTCEVVVTGFTQLALGLGMVVCVTGCRTATRITNVPRVDLELSGGNRGYLVGTPPAEAELKTTRQMVETTIELPSFYKPKRSSRPVSLDDVAPPEQGAGEAPGGAADDVWQQVPPADTQQGTGYKK